MRYGREPLAEIERRNKGWLNSENCPPVDVFVDGKRVENAMAVHRKRGKVLLAVKPLRQNRRGEILTQAVYGCVTVKLKD